MTEFEKSKFDIYRFGKDGSRATRSLSVRRRAHTWVTVVNPTNHRLLLQACDDCGVVKSENSIIRSCKAPKGLAMISSSLHSASNMAM